MYPAKYEARPRQQFERDLEALQAIDPRIEVVDVRYVEDDALRNQHGASPGADLRDLAPELTPEQVDAFSRVKVVLAQDLPYDVRSIASGISMGASTRWR
jgi:hypothetical protein